MATNKVQNTKTWKTQNVSDLICSMDEWTVISIIGYNVWVLSLPKCNDMRLLILLLNLIMSNRSEHVVESGGVQWSERILCLFEVLFLACACGL